MSCCQKDKEEQKPQNLGGFDSTSPAMEVRRLLAIKLAPDRAAVLSGTEPLEAIIDQLGVLFVEIFVRHDIRGAGVHLATAHLQSRDKERPAAFPFVRGVKKKKEALGAVKKTAEKWFSCSTFNLWFAIESHAAFKKRGVPTTTVLSCHIWRAEVTTNLL